MIQRLEAGSDWDTVRKSLEDKSWDFRTVEGIAKETELSPERIEAALNAHGAEVRKANVLDSEGRVLYALAARGVGFRELAANTQAFISGTPA